MSMAGLGEIISANSQRVGGWRRTRKAEKEECSAAEMLTSSISLKIWGSGGFTTFHRVSSDTLAELSKLNQLDLMRPFFFEKYQIQEVILLQG